MMIKQKWKEELDAIALHRGWIVNSYAQVEFLLGHITLTAQRLPEYRTENWKLQRNLERRAIEVQGMLQHGPFSPYAHAIRPSLEEFSDPVLAATRHLLVHGFCIFHVTPTDDMAVQFRRFVPGAKGKPDTLERRLFRRQELAAEQERLIESTQVFIQAVGKMFLDLGLEQPD